MPDESPADPAESAGPADGSADLGALVAGVERVLLGGEQDLTRADMAEQSGMDADEIRALWRALGFAVVDDDARVFTRADLAALDDVRELQRTAGIDDDAFLAMTRIIGQAFARLASWQGQQVVEIVAASPELLAGDGHDALELVEKITPVTGRVHDYVWRRQLAAYFARVAGGALPGSEVRTAVGFADMAAFTSFTRRSSEDELRGVLGRFETLATEVVGAHRGQVVKTIGDEVLFTADDPADAAGIALDLVAGAERDDALPPMRAGVAWGTVVSRLGDVFGQPVNIAARLTTLARPGSVLVDEGMHDALRDDGDLVLHALRPTAVRGYRHLRPWRLREAGSQGPSVRSDGS